MSKICGLFYCDNDVSCKGLCEYHYQQNYHRKNKTRLSQYEKERREKPERVEYMQTLRKHSQKKRHISDHNHYQRNKKRYACQNKKYREEVKRKTLSHYSKGKLNCNCCGESTYEFLTIDHIHNNGYLQQSRGTLHRWLLKRNFPAGFQVLCWNCNCGKRLNNGVCPHLSIIREPKLRRKMR